MRRADNHSYAGSTRSEDSLSAGGVLIADPHLMPDSVSIDLYGFAEGPHQTLQNIQINKNKELQ